MIACGACWTVFGGFRPSCYVLLECKKYGVLDPDFIHIFPNMEMDSPPYIGSWTSRASQSTSNASDPGERGTNTTGEPPSSFDRNFGAGK